MYLEYFGFKKKPFENVNDKEFFYQSESHQEAYSRISFVIEDKKNCAVLSGAYGTGKTFVLKAIEKDLTRKGYIFSVISNPSVDNVGILKLILHNFIGYKLPDDKADLLILFERFLKDTHRDAKHCVVIIDEAQNIKDENVFEELRMLMNMQMDSKNLLTLILSGQSELSERLSSNKQFIQRVFLSYELKPLSLNETVEYIEYRLKVAGSNEKIFEDNAYELIYERSGGIPRWINNICNMSLLTAFTKEVKTVNEDIVSEAIESMRGEV